MLSSIRRHASFANVIAVLALVFAMTGGAYAAKKYLITSTSQIKPSVLKSLQGKAGPAGVVGPQGPQGPAGPAGAGKEGAAGKDGANGTKGENGAPGAKGETGATGPKGLPGPAGPSGPSGPPGANGTTGPAGTSGPTGPEGVCAKANCTLPSGATETGTWSISAIEPVHALESYTPISFPVRLEKASSEAAFLSALETEELDKHEKATGLGGCAGTSVFPTAPKGKLCVYTQPLSEEPASLTVFIKAAGEEELEEGYGPSGAFLLTIVKAGGKAKANGTWAVTAP